MGLVPGLMMMLAATPKWTITYFATDHLLGTLFLHTMAQDGSKYVTKLLNFVDNN
jgi:hypothetical protein